MRYLLVAVMGFVMLAMAPTANALDFKAGDLRIDHPWARASAGPAKAGAAYLTLENMGATPDRLVAVKSDVAKRTELHNHIMDGGVMLMRQVEAIEVAPGTPTVLAPGGLHVMFMGLKKPFKEGETFPLTLVFENAGEVEVTVNVQGVASKSPNGEMDHSTHKHTH